MSGLSRIEDQLTEGSSYNGSYLSRIELILKDMLATAGKIGFRGPYETVADLPVPGDEGYIYLVDNDDDEDYFLEYYWNDDTESYQSMGSSQLPDMTAYVSKAELTTILQSYPTNASVANTYATKDELAQAVAGIEAVTPAQAEADFEDVFGSTPDTPYGLNSIASATSYSSSDVTYRPDGE